MADPDSDLRILLADFKKRLTDDEIESFKYATVKDVEKTLHDIQVRQERQRKLMHMSRIQSFLEAMGEFGKIIEIFLNVSDAVAFIWGPIKFILQIASTWAHSFDTILEAYQRIGDHMPLLQQYHVLFEKEPTMKKLLLLLYIDILDFHRKAMRFFGNGKAWRQFFRSVWSDFSTRFEGLLACIKSRKDLLANQASLIHFRRYEEDKVQVFGHFERLEDQQRITMIKLDQDESDRRKAQYNKVVEWLAASSQSADHDEFCGVRAGYPGTGDWILSKTEVKSWMHDDLPRQSVLWINGMPGAGKTILASLIIDACQKISTADTIYFYCKHGDDSADTFLSILRGLLAQLAALHLDLASFFLEQKHKTCEPVLTTVRTGKVLIEALLQRGTRTYIVLDGLDECPDTERRELLKFFSHVVRSVEAKDPGQLRLLVISQAEPDIERALPHAVKLEIDPSDNMDDIHDFAMVWTGLIQTKFSLSDDQSRWIQTRVCNEAAGLFLYATLVLENFYAQATLQDLEFEIMEDRFPHGLAQAYERVLERIRRQSQVAGPRFWKHTQRLLGWMVCALRPFKWYEIQCAIAIDIAEARVSQRRKLVSDVRTMCGALVKVTSNDRVSLVHQTAKTYICTSNIIAVPLVQCDLAATCLQYLSLPSFSLDSSGIVAPADRDSMLNEAIFNGTFAFQDYATSKWAPHLTKVVLQSHDLIDWPDTLEKVDTISILENAIEDFHAHYNVQLQFDMASASSIDTAVVDPACQIFAANGPERQTELSFWLRSLWLHIQQHSKSGGDSANQISLTELHHVISTIRDTLEEILTNKLTSASTRKTLEGLYGNRHFKCAKLSCHYFHEGFPDKTMRDKHTNKHDRPYQCDVEECTLVDLGFESKKDRDSHVRNFHADVELKSQSFPVEIKAPIQSRWRCTICGKCFARNGILINHQDAHAGAKPHECQRCGKSFVRHSDCKRHERIHDR